VLEESAERLILFLFLKNSPKKIEEEKEDEDEDEQQDESSTGGFQIRLSLLNLLLQEDPIVGQKTLCFTRLLLSASNCFIHSR
jgi:hypothetical protein